MLAEFKFLPHNPSGALPVLALIVLFSSSTTALAHESIGLGGAAVGGILTLTSVGGFTASRALSWQRIGIRVAGSWIAAAAGIVLTIYLVDPTVAA